MVSLSTSYEDITIPNDVDSTEMNSNSTSMRKGVIILMKALTGESVGGIDLPKFNKSVDIIDTKIVQVSFCILYTIIFILGVFGNVIVCYVVFRNRAMQTVTNLFITNLALSDILLCIFAVPLTPLYTFLGKWVFGKLLCHLMPYVQGTSVYISTLTLTSIAINRFLVIICPLNSRMKLNTCIYIIIFIWIFSLIVTCPYGLYMEIQIMHNKVYYCEESWPSDKSRIIFGVFTTVCQFLIPFIVIALCYTFVSIRLNDRVKSKPGSKNSTKDEIERDRTKRTNRMLISMVAIFGISWLPLNLINIFNDFYASMTEWSYYYLSFFLAHSMAMASTCYNPFLYAWLNENFRKEFKQVLPCFKSRRSLNNSYYSERMRKAKSDKMANGNDTIQDTRLPSSVKRPSIKQRLFDGNGKSNEDHIEHVLLETQINLKKGSMQLINEEMEMKELDDIGHSL